MSVTRDKLYEEVWAEPMAKVAVRYRISANYLARVCHHLNVPFPHRGCWAKRLAGKAPGRPGLSPPRPGEVLAWERGDAVPRVAQKPETASREPMRVAPFYESFVDGEARALGLTVEQVRAWTPPAGGKAGRRPRAKKTAG